MMIIFVIVNLKENYPMTGLCNLKNVVYQVIIFAKKNVKDEKNLYWNFVSQMEVRI